MTKDPWQDPTAVAWARHVVEDMAPKMRDSSCCISLVPDGQGDVKFWVELGASIMMEKPVIAVVMGDRELPPKFVAIADEVVRLPEGVNAAGSDALLEAIMRVTKRLGGG